MSDGGAGAVVVALVRDLMFGARVRGAAPEAVIVQRGDRLAEAVGEGTRLVIVELEGAGALEAIAAARERARGARVVGFAPHVREDMLESARAAGAEVLSRGAFVKQLPDLVAGAER